jgi:hypothetical protein
VTGKVTSKLNRLLVTFLISLSVIPVAHTGAAAQKGVDPNLGHFYMARQQITITDDGPVINNKTTPPAVPGAGPGALPAGIPQGLPAARWTQYSPPETSPSLSTSLPKVPNGVPPKQPKSANGAMGKTGKLGVSSIKPAFSQAAAVKKPATAAAYAPYKKFSPDGAVSGASEAQSASRVKGDVLHWARRAHGL